jgi:hypothetical protein
MSRNEAEDRKVRDDSSRVRKSSMVQMMRSMPSRAAHASLTDGASRSSWTQSFPGWFTTLSKPVCCRFRCGSALLHTRYQHATRFHSLPLWRTHCSRLRPEPTVRLSTLLVMPPELASRNQSSLREKDLYSMKHALQFSSGERFALWSTGKRASSADHHPLT